MELFINKKLKQFSHKYTTQKHFITHSTMEHLQQFKQLTGLDLTTFGNNHHIKDEKEREKQNQIDIALYQLVQQHPYGIPCHIITTPE